MTALNVPCTSGAFVLPVVSIRSPETYKRLRDDLAVGIKRPQLAEFSRTDRRRVEHRLDERGAEARAIVMLAERVDGGGLRPQPRSHAERSHDDDESYGTCAVVSHGPVLRRIARGGIKARSLCGDAFMSCAVNNVEECAIYARGERLSTGYPKVPERRPLSWRKSRDCFGYHSRPSNHPPFTELDMNVCTQS